MLALSLLALTAVGLAACPAQVSLTWIDEQLTAGEIAFVTDPAVLVLTGDRLASALPCVDEALDARLAARLHRLQGLRHFVQDSESEARRDFAAVRDTSPSMGVPTTLIPADHRVHQLFEATELASLPTEPVGLPRQGTLLLNARERETRPTTIPVLVQHLDRRGEPLLTALVQPGEPLPVELLDRKERRWRPGWWALGVGVGMGAASGMLVALGSQAYDDYQALRPEDQAGSQGRALQDRNLFLNVGAVGAGAAGGTFFVGGLSWWSR